MTLDQQLQDAGLAYAMYDVQAIEDCFVFGSAIYRLPHGLVDTHKETIGERTLRVADIEDVMDAFA